MKLFIYPFVILLTLFSFQSYSQEFTRTCATDLVLDNQRKSNPMIEMNMEEIEKQTVEFLRKNPNGKSSRATITIPVVFHVIYDQNVPTQNISDEQIQTQIDILNKDFSATNSEISGSNFNSATYPLGNFSGIVGNPDIQFCLARQDPNGFATTGINRKASTRTNWDTDPSLKRTSSGGLDAWDTKKYLNIWVCKISLSTTNVVSGYAQHPGGDPSTDGVVLDYRFVGNTGTAFFPFNKGRTATHEIGHWLNLKHIWGDATCGDDLVSDTPKHNGPNIGCPAHPHLSTCTGTPAEMTMNFLDYTDDQCMYMFSSGQKSRMQAVLSIGAARGSIVTSNGCQPPNPTFCYAPSRINLNNITITTADINWSASANALSYTIEYKLNNATTWLSLNLTSTSANLTGLKGSSTYNMRVKAICANGSSLYSSTINFTTLVPPTCNIPASLTTTKITPTTATANWGAVLNVLNYTFEYKTKASTKWIVAPGPITTNSYTFTGLLPATSYNFRVKTNCNGMSSAYSATASFTTLSACTGDSEANNSAGTARTTLKSNTTIKGKLGTSTDVDWFKFVNTSSAKNIKVSLSGLTANYNLDLYFGSSTSPSLVGTSQNKELINEVINYNNGAVGTYYIKVYSPSLEFDNINCYNLLAQLSSSTYSRPNPAYFDEKLLSMDHDLLIFPNPSSDKVSLFLPFGENNEGVLQIYDITGKMKFAEKIQNLSTYFTLDLDISEFKSGLYMVHFKSGSDSYSKKMIITE